MTENGTESPSVDVDLTIPHTANKCQVCKQHIHTMCFQGTGVCSLTCKKLRDGDN